MNGRVVAVLLLLVGGCDLPRDAGHRLDRVQRGYLRVGLIRNPPWVDSGRPRFPFGYLRPISISYLIAAASLSLLGAWLLVDALLKLVKQEGPWPCLAISSGPAGP
jgi:hypothetical protein